MNRLEIKTKSLEEILSEEELGSIPIKNFTAESIEYYNNDTVFYFMKSGKAKVTIYKCREEYVLYNYSVGNIYVPEKECVLEFVEDSELYVLNYETIQDLYKNIDFCNFVTYSLSQRSRLQREIIYDLAFNKSKEKITSFILSLIDYEKKEADGHHHINFNMTVHELACYINVRRQTISSFLNAVMKSDIIVRTSHNAYIIKDIQKLKNFGCSK